MSHDILQGVSRAWFPACPALICIGIIVHSNEFRLMRRWAAYDGCLPRSTVIPQYRANRNTKEPFFDNEVSAFSLDGSDGRPKRTPWSDTYRNIMYVLRHCMAGRGLTKFVWKEDEMEYIWTSPGTQGSQSFRFE
ncbi:hypothetical protein DENSPDRAFT_842636 [Dentipellis sp. KUC8613]|nr:hypothetical protein DENSPDRAFT_842636 [Dentipellis sp. KUC8613]